MRFPADKTVMPDPLRRKVCFVSANALHGIHGHSRWRIVLQTESRVASI